MNYYLQFKLSLLILNTIFFYIFTLFTTIYTIYIIYSYSAIIKITYCFMYLSFPCLSHYFNMFIYVIIVYL